jgi:hypothetical protein
MGMVNGNGEKWKKSKGRGEVVERSFKVKLLLRS